MREIAGLLRRQHALVTASGEQVHFAPRDPESECEIFGSLSHQQADDGIGQALHQPDYRGEKSRLESRDQRRALGKRLRGVPIRQPQHHRVGEQERNARQRIDAACEHEVRAARANIVDRGIERLHARRAVPHHGPARNLVTAAHAQSCDASDIDFVGRGCGATQNHLIELGRREWLA